MGESRTALEVGVQRPIALLLTLNMLGALLMVHLPAGLFVESGGYELVLALGAGALAITLAGPGAFSLDKVLASKFRRFDGALAA